MFFNFYLFTLLFPLPSDIGAHVTPTSMAHKSHEIFQRLSSKSRALSTSKARYAWRSRKKRKKHQLTPAEKAQRAESRRVHQRDYKSALSNARATLMAEAVKLREQFGGHSVDYYYEEIIQRSRLDRSKRKVTRWNVYLRQEVCHLNDGRLVFVFAFFFSSQFTKIASIACK